MLYDEYRARKSAEEILLDEAELLTTTRKQVTTTNTNTILKIIFNNGTSAGILGNLKKCTRAMHLHEVDVTLKISSELGGKENQSGRIRVIFNESSTAGVLELLKGCTRLSMTEEGDVVLTRIGVFLLSTTGIREPNVLEDCQA
ncbi:unnamed protein product [Adineta steineri]|uniref:Uncharacterized protein n=1 Tax=Adineta steineri TaxID=433720 RepID=A0A819P3K2_9BILA|nr:unnamed protein product [Adineta steineri]